MTKYSFLTSFHLKLMMAALMVLDHVYEFIPGVPLWFHASARIVAPVFAFFIAQGLVHTRDADKYVSRLLWFGVATLAGNNLLAMVFHTPIPNCILITFALSAKAILCIDKWAGGDKRLVWPACAALLMFATLFFEGSILILAMVLVFYYLRERPFVMCAVFAAASLAICFALRIADPLQWLMVLAAVPILLYNGRRGVSGAGGFFIKYAFYLFYPVHLWAIYLIAHLGGFR